MAQRRPAQEARVWGELGLMNVARLLPPAFEGSRIGAATPVFDLNGEELFVRVPLRKGGAVVGYADVATHPGLGAVLLAVSQGLPWNERALLAQARKAAGRRLRQKPDSVRFVAYSYPKVAVQFLAAGQELAMLELWTWLAVPPRSRRSADEPPSNFERWSLIDEQPPAARRRNAARFQKRVAELDAFVDRAKRVPKDRISRPAFERVIVDIRALLSETRELHLTSRDADHFTCYEVRGQETNVWCVAGSVQMLLDFYRYEYSQVRLAAALGLGTLANPNGLPYSRDGDVVTVIEKMSSGALDAAMNTSPSWSQFRAEIRANRPLISFIPGHSRTVAGYTRFGLSGIGLTPFRGLLVYDPWPPNVGVVTRWENFDGQTYRRTFAAAPELA
jgi:hypothetical protein